MADDELATDKNGSGDATASQPQPDSLYVLCLKSMWDIKYVKLQTLCRDSYIKSMPPRLLADIYLKHICKRDMCGFLIAELTNMDSFIHMLRYGFTRENLIYALGVLVNQGADIPNRLSICYEQQVEEMTRRSNNFMLMADNQLDVTNPEVVIDKVTCGLNAASILDDGGWWSESIRFASSAHALIDTYIKLVTAAIKAGHRIDEQLVHSLDLLRIQCLCRLLNANARYFSFPQVLNTLATGERCIELVGMERLPRTLRTMWYLAKSVLYFARSDYDNSTRCGCLAVRELYSGTPEKLAIDVLRQTAKACVLKRQFQRAKMLIEQAIRMAKSTYGSQHYKYADVLMDYAFYLLNVDSIAKSVSTYKEALRIRYALMGHFNLHVAIAREDLAYALYVHNYSSGDFASALHHVNVAIEIMRKLLHDKHLFLASAKRVKALILEEIALEEDPRDDSPRGLSNNNQMLIESEELHQSALSLSLDAFGEQNVTTAKHYGNLGRLYQSMKRYEDAEQMHNLAIRIKTDILGPCDFEVGLSIGHLASLYNYHMQRYREAEVLYLRSIEISLKLFGDVYSGLEYDYRGLCNVYELLEDEDKCIQYYLKLDGWRQQRAIHDEQNAPTNEVHDDQSLEELTEKFFEMCQIPPGSTPVMPTLYTIG